MECLESHRVDGIPAADLTPAQLQARVARNLVWVRELLYRSQAEAARAFSIGQVAYNRYELGQRAMPLPLMVQWCERHGLTTDYFVRSSLVGLPPELSLRLAAAYPILLEEWQLPDTRPAHAGQIGTDGTRGTFSVSIPGKVRAPAP